MSNSHPHTKAYLTVADMAARYGCSKQAIYNRRGRGQLPPAMQEIKGGKLRWRLDVVEAHERALLEQDAAAAAERERQMRAPEPAAA